MSPQPYDTRSGWTIYLHEAFAEQLDSLTKQVERLAEDLDRKSLAEHPKARLLARVRKIILDDVPNDPASKRYALGNAMGSQFRHWCRAKFNERFRIFFRYQSKGKIIVYGWMNDEKTLRSRGAKTDVYEVFAKRLRSGYPPDGWDDLLKGS